MVRSQSVLSYLLVITALLLSACASTNTVHHVQSAGVAVAPNQRDVLLPPGSQHEFEILLKSLNSKGDMVNTLAAVRQQHNLLKNPLANAGQTVKSQEIKSRILQQYDQWKGVRYRLGGKNRSGVDCSAFVQRTFIDQFGIELPRSTSEQIDSGERISRAKLRSGDLVLFRAGSTGRHVGIYLGNNKFVHASVRKGVIISNMDNPYWKKRYKEARRILVSNTNPAVDMIQ